VLGHPGIEDLSLQACDLDEADCNIIRQHLPANVRKLDVSINDLSDNALRHICNTPPPLQSLSLIGIHIRLGRAQIISQSQIPELILRECVLRDDTVAELARGTFRSLDVSSNEFGDAGARALARMTNLESLKAANCRFTPVGAGHLLSRPEGFRSLDISRNRLDPSISPILSTLNVAELNMSNTRGFGAQGVQAWYGLHQIRRLTAQDCGIDGDGAELLARHGFQHLDLRGNQIGQRGIAALQAIANQGATVFYGDLPR
jgi:hypothetical protein